MGHNKVNVKATFSYWSTKYGTRRNPFILVHKKMELKETTLLGPEMEQEETLLYGPTKRKL